MHLLSAIEAGYITPALRGSAENFGASLNLIEQQDIRGRQEGNRIIAARLDGRLALLAQKKTPEIKHWPADLSIKYAKAMIEGLNRIEDPVEAAAWNVHLPQTGKFLRKHSIIKLTEDAIAADIPGKKKVGELQRGAFYKILLDVLNKKYRNPEIKAVNDCQKELVSHPACADDALFGEAIPILVALANATYHLNMASNLDAGTYLPARHFSEGALPGRRIALSVKHGVPPSEVDGESYVVESREFTACIPDVDVLRTAKWSELLAIRAGDGDAYFAALENWDNHPDEFQRCLDKYAAALTSTLKVTVPPAKVLFHRFKDSDQKYLARFADGTLNLYAASEGINKSILSLAGLCLSMCIGWKLYDRPVNLHIPYPKYPTAIV